MAILTMVGVGHSESIRHWNNNAMITANGHRLLIDAGYTIKYALRDQGLSFKDVDSIFITHVHADHCFGLERLGYECRFLHGFKPRLYLPPGVYEELWEHTLRGVMGQVGEGEATLSDFFDIVILEGGSFKYHGIDLKYFHNQHTPTKPSYSLLINDRFFFSGDTKALPALVAELDPDIMLHDCSLTDSNPVHATLAELEDCYPAALCKRTYLMSYQDTFNQFSTRVESRFSGFAKQGQEFEL